TPYVVRDQEDLRSIFERKMQERQEFLDRYFVFADDSEWEPPKDFTRTNGLVEEIRQAMLKEKERARLEEETRPRRPKTHEAVEPIALPTISTPPKSAGGSASTGGGSSGDDSSKGSSSSSTTKTPPRGTLKAPVIPARPGGNPDRVE
ncbi:MAG: type II secretion system protein GspD, partial [Myxococcales bacterium]|nr:type II secretion system protein GspD [Myxococcales bacterium]